MKIDFLKYNDIIGVTAPSKGVGDNVDKKRFHNAVKNLNKRGYRVIFTSNVFSESEDGRSSDKKVRADEFMSLIKNEEVKLIVSAKGGDYLMEMLPYIDYGEICKNPKWIQGYSDNTGLLFSITTKTGIPTVYCNNFGDFGMGEYHRSVEENLQILEGKLLMQKSFGMYEDEFYDKITGFEGYAEDKEVYYKGIKNNVYIHEAVIEGVFLGGCLDVIMDLAGTPYEEVKKYIEKQNKGIIWYFESFATNSERMIHNMWKLKEMGWFENTNGIIFGRPMFYDEYNNISY